MASTSMLRALARRSRMSRRPKAGETVTTSGRVRKVAAASQAVFAQCSNDEKRVGAGALTRPGVLCAASWRANLARKKSGEINENHGEPTRITLHDPCTV